MAGNYFKRNTDKNCLKVLYHGFGRPEKEHVFSAYLLKEYRNRWYTVGYSATGKNILILALDRINDIKRSTEKYIVDNEFTPASFFEYSFGITQVHAAKAEKVELLFTPQQAPYIESQPLHHSQQSLSNDDKGLHIRMKVYITRELIMSILYYGADAKVLAPKKLISQIRDHIEEMVKMYDEM